MGLSDLFRGLDGRGSGSGIGRTKRPDGVRRQDEEFLLAAWTDSLVFTDALPRKGAPPQETNVVEADLFDGEISATTFLVGCYTVRLAARAYRGGEDLVPAAREDVARLREQGPGLRRAQTADLHLRYEVSARPYNRPQDLFRKVCFAEQGTGSALECVETVCTAKRSESESFERASLLVGVRSFFGGQTLKTWYMLDADGNVSLLGASDEPLR